jgi:hypothetical protein
MITIFILSLCGLFVAGLVALAVLATFRRVSDVVRQPEDTVDLTAKLDDLVQEMRERGFSLDLCSTFMEVFANRAAHGDATRYSAFFHTEDAPCCDECESVENSWDNYQHADTLDEVIRLAAAQALEDQS